MKFFLSRWLIVFLLAGAAQIQSPAQVIGADMDGGEILTRGPVHEAFAGVVNFRPEAGLIVNQPPPDIIEELPPEERPVEADTAWIPGYWGWDDERNDFIWISGTWRVLPPGRAWIPGYWNDTGRGWQWVSGYWEDASRREVVYLAPPPETLERGPSTPPPSPDYEWVPGCWEWRDDRYLWRPGYWIEGRMEWVWVPSSYVWTPRGYVFIDGYWDYAPAGRGLLFAPVYYREHRRSRYEYRPSVVLNVAILVDYLFLRPRYSHYYFGDYYDARYESSGIYATYVYDSSRRGYDPFYSYSRWRHRDDRDWDRQYRESYDYRRRNQDARPPRTWSGSALTVNVSLNAGTQIGGGARRSETITYAQPLQEYARSTDARIRVERSAPASAQQQMQVARQVQEQRAQRRTIESQGGSTFASQPSGSGSRPASSGQVSGATRESAVASPAVTRVALPAAPIVAREGAGGRQPPPRAQSNRRDGVRAVGGNEVSRRADSRSPVIGEQSAGQRAVGQEPVIGAPGPAPQDQSARARGRMDPRMENAPAADARRQEQPARQQAEEAAPRNVSPQDPVGLQRELPPQANERAGQARQRAEERRAVGAAESAAQGIPAANRNGGDQQRRDQERPDQRRAEQQQAQQQADARYQQAEAQLQAREQQGRAAEQAREQQSRAAEQERGRRAESAGQQRAQQQQAQAVEQARAAEQARAQQQQAQAAEQAHSQQQQAQAAEQARSQQQHQAEAAEQANAQRQQAQAAEQSRAQEAQAAAEQARHQQAQAAQQAEAARQKGLPNRQKAQPPPPQKNPPPKDQSDQSDEEERKKRKG